MKQLAKDVAADSCRNSCKPIGTGNNNIIIIIIIILLICSCGGTDNVLGSYGRRRGRRRGTGTGLLVLVILALILSGNNPGRNINTNIINLDTAALEEPEDAGILDL